MNKSQFSERIGNIDERLVEQAERVPNYARQGRQRLVRRIAAAAAALAVMVCGGFGLGATVFAQEIEVPVEVPVEPESVTFADYGVTLILPDSWKGNYAVDGDSIYVPSVREHNGGEAGVLFSIGLYSEQITKDEYDTTDGSWNVVPSRYIMTTANGTLFLYCASDVQYDPSIEADAELYSRMYKEVSQIRFVVDNALAD